MEPKKATKSKKPKEKYEHNNRGEEESLYENIRMAFVFQLWLIKWFSKVVNLNHS